MNPFRIIDRATPRSAPGQMFSLLLTPDEYNKLCRICHTHGAIDPKELARQAIVAFIDEYEADTKRGNVPNADRGHAANKVVSDGKE